MGRIYSALVGVPPVCTSFAFRDWFLRLVAAREAECPRTAAGETRYYFSQGGNTGNPGTLASPKKTIADAQAVHDAAGGAGRLRLSFRRGDTWRGEAGGLTISKSNVTVDDYSDGTAGHTDAHPKPIFSQWLAAYSKAGWALTATRTYTYERAEANDVAWVRELSDLTLMYVRATSIAEVEATEASFWWDSGSNKVYVHPRGNVSPITWGTQFEALVSTAVTGVLTTGDSIRVENIVVDGYGAQRLVANDLIQKWCFRHGNDNAMGTNAAVFKGCEGYYSTLHNAGLLANSGGIVTLINCRFGRMTGTTSGTNVVGFSNSGGHELLTYNVTTIGGTGRTLGANYTAVNEGGLGVPIYGHTSGGTNYFNLAISWGCRNTPDQYQEHIPTRFACVPPWTDLRDCRAFVVDDVFDVRQRTSLDKANDAATTRYIGTCPDSNSYDVAINCVRVFRVLSVAAADAGTQFVFSGTPDGVDINCKKVFDFAAYQPTDGAQPGGLFQIAPNGTPATQRWYNSTLDFRTGGQHSLTLGYVNGVLNSALYLSAGVLKNCIITGGPIKGSGNFFNLGFNNAAANLANNAYCGVTNKTDTYAGYSNDPYLVELPAGSPRETLPDAATALLSTHQQLVEGYPLEYDFNWARRAAGATAIGPEEFDQARGAVTGRLAPLGLLF